MNRQKRKDSRRSTPFKSEMKHFLVSLKKNLNHDKAFVFLRVGMRALGKTTTTCNAKKSSSEAKGIWAAVTHVCGGREQLQDGRRI